MHMVKLSDVNCVYPDNFHALTDICFEIAIGEKIGIVGPNGAGKTTLLSVLTGLILPIRGEVSILGSALNSKTVKDIRKHLGFVFQNPDDQLFMPTVYDDVAFGPLAMGLPHESVEERVENAFERTGTKHLKDRLNWKLSGGEKRSVAIASVLACSPELLILDEPTSGLDPKARRNLIYQLKQMPQTQIITSHDLEFIRAICPRTLILSGGRLLADGATEALFSDSEQLEAWGL